MNSLILSPTRLLASSVLLAGMLVFIMCSPAMAASDQEHSNKDEQGSGDDTKASADADNKDASLKTHALSIAPQAFPIYPEDRPIWVDNGDVVRSDDHWAELVVHSIPSLSPSKSEESLREQIRTTIGAYLDQWLGQPGAGQQIPFTDAEIESNWIDHERQYHGPLTTSTGEMFEDACVLQLDDSFHQIALARWQDARVADHLKTAGWIGLATFMVLIAATMTLKSADKRRNPPAA